MSDVETIAVPLDEWQEIQERLLQLDQADNSRKHTESKLIQERNLLRTLIDNLPDCIFVKDCDGRVVTVNRAGAQSVGTDSPEDVVGTTDYDFHTPEMAEIYQRDERRVLNQRESIISKEYILYHHEKKKNLWYSCTKAPLIGPQGDVIGLVGISRDVTDLKRMREKLEQANIELEQQVQQRTADLLQTNQRLNEEILERHHAQERLSQFREEMARAERLASLGTASAVMAHELNQPLTVIRLFLQQSLRRLGDIACPETVTQKLKDCLVEISNAIAIILRFRHFTRIPPQSIVADVNLNDIVERVVAVLSHGAKRAKIQPMVEIDDISGIRANIADLEQLLFIFTENAIQAADGQQQRQLRIAASAQDDQLCLEFADECGGIAPKNQQKIFEAFFTTKPAGVGTGLGLSIATNIVTQYGGKITLQSELHRGSTFTVTLPKDMSL